LEKLKKKKKATGGKQNGLCMCAELMITFAKVGVPL